uniref:Uncharacterized protein n=1 Tax=Arundo donax TaxID=35708 RepID=A0A0A9BVS8_ARUDO
MCMHYTTLIKVCKQAVN